MSKNEQIDLLPWIFSGLLIAVAVPAVMALTGGTKVTPQAPRVAMVASDSVNTVPVPIPPAPLPATVAPVAPVAPESATQIWQCVSNGQKTFSDSPCGAGASVHQLSEINRMDATPVSHTTAYSAYPSLNYAAAPPDQDTSDVDGGGYSTSQVIAVSERQRREHSHRTHDLGHRVGLAHN